MSSDNRHFTVTDVAKLFEVTVEAVVQVAEKLGMPMGTYGFDSWEDKWSKFSTALKREQKKALTKANKQAKAVQKWPPLVDSRPTRAQGDATRPKSTKRQSRYVIQDFESKQDADIARIQEQIVALQIKNDQLRKTLIPRDDVRRVFTELYSIEATEFRFLGDRVGPAIASLVDIERPEVTLKISQLITEEVSHTLAHIDGTFKKFLDGLQTEEE